MDISEANKNEFGANSSIAQNAQDTENIDESNALKIVYKSQKTLENPSNKVGLVQNENLESTFNLRSMRGAFKHSQKEHITDDLTKNEDSDYNFVNYTTNVDEADSMIMIDKVANEIEKYRRWPLGVPIADQNSTEQYMQELIQDQVENVVENQSSDGKATEIPIAIASAENSGQSSVPKPNKTESRYNEQRSSSNPFGNSYAVNTPMGIYPVVEIRRGFKRLRSIHKSTLVLSRFNMNVFSNKLYCLVGPRKSGKTTICRIIIGRLRLDAGSMRLYRNDVIRPTPTSRQQPHVTSRVGSSRSAQHPRHSGRDSGPVIGYMPQELCLDERFTIAETFRYFGELFRIPQRTVDERLLQLSNLLELPTTTDSSSHTCNSCCHSSCNSCSRCGSSRQLRQLRAHELRAVSFALTLLHRPTLLVLDEPTAGVDPVLRHLMWQHLYVLLRQPTSPHSHPVTVIMTSHDLSEAPYCDAVGLMLGRGGTLVAEGAPSDVIRRAGVGHLRDVVMAMMSRFDGDDMMKGFYNKKTTTVNNENENSDNTKTSAVSSEKHLTTTSSISAEAVTADQPTADPGPSVQTAAAVKRADVTAAAVTDSVSVHRTGSAGFLSTAQIRNNAEITRIDSGRHRAKDGKSESCCLCWMRLCCPKTTSSESSIESIESETTVQRNKRCFSRNVRLLTAHAVLKVCRDYRRLAAMAFLPPLYLIVFGLAVGLIPNDLKIGVVNNEGYCEKMSEKSHDSKLSCNVLKYLSTDKAVQLIYFEEMTNADKALRVDNIKAILTFVPRFDMKPLINSTRRFGNFDQNSENRNKIWKKYKNIRPDKSLEYTDDSYRDSYEHYEDTDYAMRNERDIIGKSTELSNPDVLLITDSSNVLVRDVLREAVTNSLRHVIRDHHVSQSESAVRMPVIVLKSVHSLSINFKPHGMLVWGGLIAYSFAVGAILSAASVADDKDLDVSDRLIAAGVTRCQLYQSHFLCWFLLISLQSLVMTSCAAILFLDEISGRNYLVLFLSLLAVWLYTLNEALCGIAFGFFIYCLVRDRVTAVKVVLYFLCPLLLLSGIIWPVESLSPLLRRIVFLGPINSAAEAIKVVLMKYQGLLDMQIIYGILSPLSFTAFFILVGSLALMRYD